jgi:hypothetical protein
MRALPAGCENVASAHLSSSVCHSTLPPLLMKSPEHGVGLLCRSSGDDMIIPEHYRRVLTFGLCEKAKRQDGVDILGAEQPALGDCGCHPLHIAHGQVRCGVKGYDLIHSIPSFLIWR